MSTNNHNKSATAPSQDVIQDWLTNKVAERSGMHPQLLNTREPFAQWGLDSMEMVCISGDLEEWLGLRLSPTLLYDYPTIEQLARYLAEKN